MRTTRVALLIGLAPWWVLAGCSDNDSTPECYSYTDCADGQVCYSGTCASSTVCGEIDGLRRAIYEAAKEHNGQGPLDASGNEVLPELCTHGEPLWCNGKQEYEVCAQRDDAMNTGCAYYWPDTAVDVSSVWSWRRYQSASCGSSSVCVDADEGASCVPVCTSSSSCDSEQRCQQQEGGDVFLCGAPQPSPSFESRCTVTAVDAVIDSSGLEGPDWTSNKPDLYVVLTSGGYRENTSVMLATTQPAWEHTFPELSYGEVAAMRVILMEDDDAFLGIVPNFDDEVWEWTSEDGAWRMSTTEGAFDLSGGPVERLTMRISCP